VGTFYIGKTEVTWGEWKEVRTWAAANGYTDLANVGQGVGDNYPVTHVNWYDVVKWCNARSEKEGKIPVYKNGADVYRTGYVSEPAVVVSANGYRLPSEKEWEFAARGGTQTQGYIYSGSNDLNAVGWYGENSGGIGAVKEVGKKQANELGIFDMSGNLWEWSGSWYPGHEGSSRVFRGGFWGGYAGYCRVANRGNVRSPGYRDNYYGFRVALSAAP
jgi:formylglycine-generating enzyme required for sulfatase activity